MVVVRSGGNVLRELVRTLRCLHERFVDCVIAWISRSTSRRRFTEVADETTGPRSCPRAVMLLDRCRRTTDCAGRRQRHLDHVGRCAAPGNFGGLNREILASTLKAEQNIADQSVYKRFWAETPEERRKKMMPFFWGTWMARTARSRGITL